MVFANGISISLSEKALKLLQSLSIKDNLPEEINKYVTEYKKWQKSKREKGEKPCLSVQDIKHLHKVLSNESKLHIHEILEDSVIEFPKHSQPPRNLELQARIEQLRREQEEKEYNEMVKNVDPKRAKNSDSSFSSDVKALRSQIVAVVNFIVSVGGTFAFGYKVMEYALPVQSIPAQVLVGISMSTIVALAELYFLAKQLDYSEG